MPAAWAPNTRAYWSAKGAKVVIGDVLDDEGHAVARQLGDNAHYLRLDVTQPEQWTSAVAETVRRFGHLNVLVNNAGVAGRKTLRKFELERWRHTLDVNLTGTFLGTQAVVDEMIRSGGGSIINISSIEGLRGAPFAHAYVASKWAVRGLTKSTAIELGRYNIRVNSVHPGLVRTPGSAAATAGPGPATTWPPGLAATPPMPRWFYGFRLAVKTDLDSRIVRSWAIVPAAVNERQAAEDLLEAGPAPRDQLADKGFNGRAFAASQATRGTAVLVPQISTSAPPCPLPAESHRRMAQPDRDDLQRDHRSHGTGQPRRP